MAESNLERLHIFRSNVDVYIYYTVLYAKPSSRDGTAHKGSVVRPGLLDAPVETSVTRLTEREKRRGHPKRFTRIFMLHT